MRQIDRRFLSTVSLSVSLPAAALLALSLLAAGCSPSDEARRAMSGPLLVGTNVWPGYEPLYLARSLDQFEPTDIRLVECSSASQVIRAFRNETIQMGALTLDEVLLLRQLGHDVQVVLVMDISHGGDVILGQTHLESLGDLRGRTIGVENTAVGAYVLARALQISKLSMSDVEVVALEVDEHERAFSSGEVDAVVTFEPVRSRLLAKGAVRLFDSTQIPREIVDVLIARRDALEQHPDQMLRLLRGWFDAVAYLRKHPDEASDLMADRMGLSPAEVLAAYDGLELPSLEENISMLAGERAELVVTAKRLAEVMKQENLLPTEIDVSDLFSAELLQQLQAP